MSRISTMVLSALGLLLLAASLASAQDAAVTRGEKLFKPYCAACHSIGAGVVVGPDLKGVTERRKEDWLKSFISNPGRMLREKDPTTVELVAKFDGYVMPTLGLSERNVSDLISYLGSEAR